VSVVVLDTDVASSLLRRRSPESVAAQLAGHIAAVTFVTVGELTKWTLVRHRGPRNVATMREFLTQLLVLPYDRRLPPDGVSSRPADNCEVVVDALAAHLAAWPADGSVFTTELGVPIRRTGLLHE